MPSPELGTCPLVLGPDIPSKLELADDDVEKHWAADCCRQASDEQAAGLDEASSLPARIKASIVIFYLLL